jgi:hypothetical protein
MVLFVAVLGQLLAALWRRATMLDSHALAALCAMSGLAAGGIFLHSFGDIQTSYPAWALAGLAASRNWSARRLAEPSLLAGREHSANRAT